MLRQHTREAYYAWDMADAPITESTDRIEGEIAVDAASGNVVIGAPSAIAIAIPTED